MIFVTTSMKKKEKQLKFSRRALIYYIVLTVHRKTNRNIEITRSETKSISGLAKHLAQGRHLYIFLMESNFFTQNRKYKKNISITKCSLFYYLSTFFYKIPVLRREEITGPLKCNILGCFLQTLKMFTPLGGPQDKKKKKATQQSEVLFLLANSVLEFITLLPNYAQRSFFFSSFLPFSLISFFFFSFSGFFFLQE